RRSAVRVQARARRRLREVPPGAAGQAGVPQIRLGSPVRLAMTRRRMIAMVVLLATFVAGAAVGAIGSDELGWRVKLYGKKLLGDLAELQWSELLEMTAPTGRFRLEAGIEEGRSPDAAIGNPQISEADIREGERLFKTHCAVCHGADASGGRG